jgi:hypothetical protein
MDPSMAGPTDAEPLACPRGTGLKFSRTWLQNYEAHDPQRLEELFHAVSELDENQPPACY